MGIDKNAVGMLQQGVGLAGDVMNLFNGSNDGTPDYTGMVEEKAKMMELDAQGDALDVQRHAKAQAKGVRATQERIRSRRNAGWGKSNLALDGSKRMVMEGNRIKDQQAEEDLLFEGDVEAQDLLNSGRRDANLFRINGNASPVRSTLSLGSKIYK